MKKLHFQYKMELNFDGEVREHHSLLRCRPMETNGQTLLSFVCRTDPATSLCEVRDGFGNLGLAGQVRNAHDHFFVFAEGCVEKTMARDGSFHPMYRYPSGYTETDETMRKLVRERLAKMADPSPAQEKACALMEDIQTRVSYVPGVTNTKTTALEAFQAGKGVCQDYAHIFLALCRYANIPSRYVAGIMVGEGESHAWVEIWDGNAWIGLDPTHNCLTDECYIKLSHGRDFADAAVDRGCFLGAASQQQTIYIKVEEK